MKRGSDSPYDLTAQELVEAFERSARATYALWVQSLQTLPGFLPRGPPPSLLPRTGPNEKPENYIAALEKYANDAYDGVGRVRNQVDQTMASVRLVAAQRVQLQEILKSKSEAAVLQTTIVAALPQERISELFATLAVTFGGLGGAAFALYHPSIAPALIGWMISVWCLGIALWARIDQQNRNNDSYRRRLESL